MLCCGGTPNERFATISLDSAVKTGVDFRPGPESENDAEVVITAHNGICEPVTGDIDEGAAPATKLKLHRIAPAVGRGDSAVIYWSRNSRLWGLFRDVLKWVPFARVSIRWMRRTFRFHRLYYYLWYFSVPAPRRRWRDLCRLSDHAGRSGEPVSALSGPVVVERKSIRVFPVGDGDCLSVHHKRDVFPGLVVTSVEGALIYGRSNLVQAGEQVLHHDLYDFEHDSTSEELHGRAMIDPRNNRIRWLDHDAEPVRFASGATFVDSCAANYAHWISEVLPRIALFAADERFRDVPIVVDDDLHSNILESLYLLVGPGREVIVLPLGRGIAFDLLHVTGATGYVAFDQSLGRFEGHSQGRFHPAGFQAVRTVLREVGAQAPDATTPRKLYLRRNSGTRRLLNSTEIERLLLDRGFRIVEPEHLTFVEQLSMFRWADVIIGATGAACANIVFCRPGTRVAILMGKHQNMPYRYWANMAGPLGVDVDYVLGPILKRRSLGIHGDFRVDPDDVKDLLDAMPY